MITRFSFWMSCPFRAIVKHSLKILLSGILNKSMTQITMKQMLKLIFGVVVIKNC